MALGVLSQEMLSDHIGPYWGTYGIGYRALQPLLVREESRPHLVHIFGTVEAVLTRLSLRLAHSRSELCNDFPQLTGFLAPALK